MLKKFEVKNFKQFSDLTIDFSQIHDYKFNKNCLKNGIIKSALIYGKNASGKTNFGFALFDITCHLFDNSKGNDPYYKYYVNADHANQEAEFFYTFVLGTDNIQYNYKKIAVDKLTEEELIINQKKVFSYNYITKEKDITPEAAHDYGLEKLNWLFSDDKVSVLRYIANNTKLETGSPIYNLMTFVSHMLWFRRADKENSYIGFQSGSEHLVDFIADNKLEKDFEKFLNEFGVNETLQLLKSPDGKNNLYFKHEQQIPFDVTASSGTHALYLFYYWYKHLEDVTFLFIDEFDAFYHPKLAKKIVQLLITKFDNQFILTTHDPYLMSNYLMRPDCCFVIDKNGIKSLPDSTERELREGNNIEKLYLSGEFDG